MGGGLVAADYSWAEAGQEELRTHAYQLFEQMLASRPVEADWTRLRQYLTLMFDLRDYEGGRPHRQEEAAPEPSGAAENAGELNDEAEPSALPTPEPDIHVGTFHQGLRGGKLVIETGLEIPVVERIVVAAGFRHGDLIQAIQEGTLFNGQPKYYFKRIRPSCGGDNPDRIEALGVVQRHQNRCWVVRANALDVLITDFHLREHSGTEGDVVTVAYMQSEIRDGRVNGVVVKIHESSTSDSVTVQPQRLRRGDSPERTTPEPAVRFVGMPQVLIVGGRNWPFYRDGITLLGGEPEHVDGFATDRSIDDVVSRADIVVVIKPYCSHGHYDKVKAVAKDKGRLFYSTSRENWSGLRHFFEQEIIPAWNAQGNEAAD